MDATCMGRATTCCARVTQVQVGKHRGNGAWLTTGLNGSLQSVGMVKICDHALQPCKPICVLIFTNQKVAAACPTHGTRRDGVCMCRCRGNAADLVSEACNLATK